MSTSNKANDFETLQTLDAEQRYNFLIKETISKHKIWILTDEHGCVMLNTEDEDCVPVWPTQETAQSWATDEWQSCVAQAISLDRWQSHWTPGLIDDELAIVVFPNQDNEGIVVYPEEFEEALQQQSKKFKKVQ